MIAKKKETPTSILIILTLIPLTLLALLFIFVPQPKSEDLIKLLNNLYLHYGYLIVFVGAFLESILLINLYLPGSTAVLLGAILAAQKVLFLPWIILLGTLGVLLAYTADYLLGKYGWYKLFIRFGLSGPLDNAKRRMHSKRKLIIFLSCIHPNYGALSATAAGLLHYSFSEFLIWFSISQLVWSTIWGILAFLFGLNLIDSLIKYSSYVLLILITLWTMKRLYFLKKEGPKN